MDDIIEDSSGDVITEVEQPDITEDASSDVITEDPDVIEGEEEKDLGDFWKNKAMELQRKQDNLVNELPRIIQEEVGKIKQTSTAEKQYGVEHLSQLYAYAEDTSNETNDRAWARAEIDRIKLMEHERKIEEKLQRQQQAQQDMQSKQATLQNVLSNKKLSAALVKDAGGNYSWNPKSKLAQVASQYYNDPQVSNRADGLMIALKLAYADTSSVGEVQLKRQNAQLKKQTLTEGGGAVVQGGKKDDYSERVTALRQNPSRENARAAISAYMNKRSK